MSPDGRSRADGRDVELDLRVLVVEVDRRRADPVVDGEDGRDRLQRAGAAEQVTGHRLGAGHHDLVGVVAEGRVDHQALGDVALRGRGGMGVDVDDVGGRRCPTPASARSIARAPPRPAGSGWAMSWESAVIPAPSTSA